MSWGYSYEDLKIVERNYVLCFIVIPIIEFSIENALINKFILTLFKICSKKPFLISWSFSFFYPLHIKEWLQTKTPDVYFIKMSPHWLDEPILQTLAQQAEAPSEVIIRIWERSMREFTPSDLVTLNIGARQSEVSYSIQRIIWIDIGRNHWRSRFSY